MLLTFGAILIAVMFLVRPLQRNPFFTIYFALMMMAAFLTEHAGYRFAPFSKQSFLIFLPWHFVLINLMTIVAYGVDKKAARKGQWRVPEMQLHLMELSGGSPGAFFAQKLFHHKTKKKSFQLLFWFVLAFQVVVVYYVLKILHII